MDTLPTTITELNPTTVVSMLAILIPALTSLVAKWNVSSVLRTWISLLLSAVAGAAATLVGPGGGFAWQTFYLSTMYAFVIQVALYRGVYKPNGIAAGIAAKTAGFGIGKPQPGVTENTVLNDAAPEPDGAEIQDDEGDIPGDPA